MAQNLPASQNHRSLSGDARTRSLLRGATAENGASAASARRVAAVLFAMLAAAILSCAIAIARPLPAHAESFTILTAFGIQDAPARAPHVGFNSPLDC